MALTPEEIARGRKLLNAALSRGGPARGPATVPSLAVSKLAEYVKRVADAAPPLTPEQRDRLAVLLRPEVRPS